MKILAAKSAGFCFGVKRAINIAEHCADENGAEIYTLGPIIHNPQVVRRLEETLNISARGSIDEINEGTVIIRSHGVKLHDYEKAVGKGIKVVDATCPFVKKTQQFVSSLTAEGYFVIVIGEREHPEVKGLLSYGGREIHVAASIDDLKGLKRMGKIGIVAQTTQSLDTLRAVTDFCLGICSEVKVYNTICDATTVRQSESVEIAMEVDCMIVVGGRNSANTNRLAEICRSIQSKTHHIEVAEELKADWFVGIDKTGVTAGASTPTWIIDDVIKRIDEITRDEAVHG